MELKRLLFFILILSAATVTSLNAQQTISAAGGNGSGSGGTISCTFGQVAYTTISGSGGSVLQGVQQPFEISVITSAIEADNVKLQFVLYPNPATNYLILSIKGETESKLTSYLYDTFGNLVVMKNVESGETTISIENLVSSVYYLKVADGDKTLKTFKIVKH